jgi:hypothetical protein
MLSPDFQENINDAYAEMIKAKAEIIKQDIIAYPCETACRSKRVYSLGMGFALIEDSDKTGSKTKS